MKVMEIINRRCDCRVTKVTVCNSFGERIVYADAPIDYCDEFSTIFNLNNSKMVITYSADKPLSSELLSLMNDLIEVYVENRTTWEIAENVSKNPDIYAGRATLDEMVRVAANSLVYSNMFDKAAVMFFNETLMELRGVYITGIPAYSDKDVYEFKNKRVEVTKEIYDKLMEFHANIDDIEAHIELEDKIFYSIDKVKLTKPLIITPMITANKLYGVLITYSNDSYTNTHTYTSRSTARLLNTMMMAVISNQKYEYTTSFYKEIEADMKSKQSLVTLGNYVATIAHEVKNPLISIGGFAKRLMKSVTNDDLKRMAGIIATESIRLEHLTEDILSFSKKRPPHKEEINLYELLQDIQLLFETRLMENNFKLNIKVTKNDTIYADKDQIKQVIVNLIANAMNAMEHDGTVSIEYVEKDDKCSIMISDTGPGIPLEVMPNLFKPFFTTSNSGTGLGLPISRKILNNHNGDLTVYNCKKGAVFTITLPTEKTDTENNE